MKQEQQISQLKDKVHSLNDLIHTSEEKNKEHIEQLKASKEHELTLLQNHLAQQMEEAHDF